MTVLLLANVGNRDVWVDKHAPIPGEVNPHWNKGASRRALGKAIAENWAACRPHVRLPIIGKAADHIRQQVGQIDQVILISSDQSGQEGVADHHLAQDTCELAPVVERLLVEGHGLAPGAVTHWRARDNPADYGHMRAFFRERLSALRETYPDATCYLEVSGGTPAMTSMLLTVGAELFGLDAHPLYVSEHEERPFLLDIGRRLVAESLTETIRANLNIYAYHAAANTVRDNVDILHDYIPAKTLLAALEHAQQRRNFNFADAWAAAGQAADAHWRICLFSFAADTENPPRNVLLRECIFNTKLAYETKTLFDFVVRVFQFVEGVWRYLALQLGVQFEHNGKPNEDGKELAKAWQQSHEALVDRLTQQDVRLEPVNRFVLKRLVEELAGDDLYQEPQDLLKKLTPIGDLRNRVVHQYHRITLELLRDTYYPKKRDLKRHPPEDAVDIIRAMEAVWSSATGEPFPDETPYRAINQLCREMLTLKDPTEMAKPTPPPEDP